MEDFDFAIVGQGSASFEGRCVLERAAEMQRNVPIVVVARCLDPRCYLDALELGAVDYLERPEPDDIVRTMEAELHRRFPCELQHDLAGVGNFVRKMSYIEQTGDLPF